MKNKLVASFNTAAHFIGQAFSYGPPMALFFVAAFAAAMGGGADFTASNLAMAGGMSGAGLGLALLGYSRVIGEKKEELGRSKIAHFFNFASANIGAGLTGIFGLAAFSMLTDTEATFSGAQIGMAAGAVAIGLALFTAGHTRLFGKRPASTNVPPDNGGIITPEEARALEAEIDAEMGYSPNDPVDQPQLKP